MHEISDEELKNGSAAGMMEYFMKHIQARDLIKAWREIGPLLESVKLIAGIDFVKMLVYYALTSLDDDGKMELDAILIENFICTMLKKNCDISLISEIMSLPVEAIMQIASTGNTNDDVMV